MTNGCWGRRAAWIVLALGLAACTSTGKGASGETGGSTGGTDGTAEPVSTGGVFTLTSDTAGDTSSAATTTLTSTGMESSSGTSQATGTTTEDSSTGAIDPCPGLVAALTAALEADARCELLLRLDGGGALLGWHSACGPKPEMDAFDSKGALLATSCCADSGQLISAGSPFIFYQQAMAPLLGGVGIISNHIGQVLYDATIGVGEVGTILKPGEWQSPEALGVGAGCAAPFVFVDAASYDLAFEGPIEPSPLGAQTMELLRGSIAATALPEALAQVSVDRTVALAYQEQQGGPGTSFVVLFELSPK